MAESRECLDGEHQRCGGCPDCWGHGVERASQNWLKPLSMTVEFKTPSPDAFALLTGCEVVDGKFVSFSEDQQYAVEVFNRVPVRRRAWRVVWEWLRRTPRRYDTHLTYIPNARIMGVSEKREQ